MIFSSKPLSQAYLFGFWLTGMGLFLFLLMFRMAGLRRWHRHQKQRKPIPPWFHELLVETGRQVHCAGYSGKPDPNRCRKSVVCRREIRRGALLGRWGTCCLLPDDYAGDLIVSLKVPFQVALFDEILANMRLLVSNKEEALLQEMQRSMKG